MKRSVPHGFSVSLHVIADYLPPHIEEGIYVLTADGELIGPDGSTEPPEPFESEYKAMRAGRDYA